MIEWITSTPTWAIFLTMIISMMLLGYVADKIVCEAVQLSEQSGINKLLIGATVVSLGTTIPEAVVSVYASLYGNSGIAVGNAVGSIICDTGLILGLASILGTIPINKSLVNKQGIIQLIAGITLIILAIPWFNIENSMKLGGLISQKESWGLLFALALYLYLSFYWTKQQNQAANLVAFDLQKTPKTSLWLLTLKLTLFLLVLALSSHILISSAENLALRFRVPDSVIAATIIAFGTSLPELITSISAVRKGHGELAIGNIIGADILNVFFVIGIAGAFNPDGLKVEPHILYHLLPSMLLILLVFRFGVVFSSKTIRWPFGLLLLTIYFITTILNYS